MDLGSHLKAAKRAVFAAERIILDVQAGGDLGVARKPDGSYVTRADPLAEDEIRSILLSEFPGHGFLGEEGGRVAGTGRYWWSCDPVDGTSCYINHEKTVSTALALHEDDDVIMGVIYNPFTKEMYVAGDGLETSVNGMRLPRINRRRADRSVFNFHTQPDRTDDIHILYDLWSRREIGSLVNHRGSCAYNLAQVAEGCHGVFMQQTIRPLEVWDFAAGIYMVRKVGGKATDLSGADIDMTRQTKFMVASVNPDVHEEALDMLVRSGFGGQ